MNPILAIDHEHNKMITKFQVSERNILEEILEKETPNNFEISLEEVKLDYDNFTFNEILKMIIPKDSDGVPSSYEVIGKIAHLNLREKFLPYKYLIGRIILDVI